MCVLEKKIIKFREAIEQCIVESGYTNKDGLFKKSNNGQVAFVQVDNINDEDVNWITRQQMEGQTVFNIDQNYFIWKLTELPPKISDFLDY